jgi:hypothetical protein
MKNAIPGLTEAVSSNDRNVWNAAIMAISALAGQGASKVSFIKIKKNNDITSLNR